MTSSKKEEYAGLVDDTPSPDRGTTKAHKSSSKSSSSKSGKSSKEKAAAAEVEAEAEAEALALAAAEKDADAQLAAAASKGFLNSGFAPYEYNSLRCFVKAVECDVSNAAAWDNIGTSMKDVTERVVIRLRRADVKAEAGEEILRVADPEHQYYHHERAIDALGPLATAEEKDEAVAMQKASAETCYVLEDPDTVVEAVFSQQRCFIRALELDPLVSAAWNKLGTTIPSVNLATLVGRPSGKEDTTGTATYVEVDLTRHYALLAARIGGGGGKANGLTAVKLEAAASPQHGAGTLRIEKGGGDDEDDEDEEEANECGDDSTKIPPEAATANSNNSNDSTAKTNKARDNTKQNNNNNNNSNSNNNNSNKYILRLNKRECFARAIALDMRNAHAWYNLSSLLTIKKMTIATMLTGGLLKAGGDSAALAGPAGAKGGGDGAAPAAPLGGIFTALTALQAAGNAGKLLNALKKAGIMAGGAAAADGSAAEGAAADGDGSTADSASEVAAAPSPSPPSPPPPPAPPVVSPSDPYIATVVGPHGKPYYFDKKQCLIKVIECEPEDPFAWYNLACVLKRGEVVEANMRVYKPSAGAALSGTIVALNKDKGDDAGAGAEAEAERSLVAGGGSSPKSLRERVMENRRSSSAQVSSIYDSIGRSTGGGQQKRGRPKTHVRPIPITAKDCCLNALKASNYSDFYAWTKLGQVLGGSDTATFSVPDPTNNTNNGKGPYVVTTVTGRECFFEALHLNPMYPNAWDGLATTLVKTEKITYTHPPHSVWSIKYNEMLAEGAGGDGGGGGMDGAAKSKGTGPPLPPLLVIVGHDAKGQPVYGPSQHVPGAPPRPMVKAPTAGSGSGGSGYTPFVETLNNAGCWNKAIESDPRYTMAWSSLGYTMGKTEKYSVLGVMRSQRDCYLGGIACDDKGINDKAWNGLGINLKSSEQLLIKEDPSRPPAPEEVEGVDLSKDITANRKTGKREAYGRSVLANPYNSSAWNNLGTTLGNTGSVVIDGVELYEQDCYLRAVSLNVNNSAGWYNLGSTVGSNKGVKRNPDDEATEDAGSLNATILVSGIPYTRQQCYLKAVNCNKNNSSAWGKLCGTLKEGEAVTVAGVSYDRLATLQKALQCDFENSRAWNRLGKLIDAGAYGMTEPFTADGGATAAGGGEGAAKGSNADAEAVATSKKKAGDKDGVVSDIDEDEDEDDVPEDAEDAARRARAKITAAIGAGREEKVEPYVVVQGKPYTARDCYARAVECDPSYTVAWYNLGTATKIEASDLSIKGSAFRKMDCFVKALECDEANVNAWNNLGLALTITDAAVVKGATYDKLRCFARALELEPHNPTTWTNVGCMLMSEAEAAAAAADKGAAAAAASSSAAAAGTTAANRPLSGARSRPTSARAVRPMSAKPTNKLPQTSVTIGGTSYTQIDCFIEAISQDANSSTAWAALGSLLAKEGEEAAGAPYARALASPSPGPAQLADAPVPDKNLPQIQNQIGDNPLPLSKTAAARLTAAAAAHPQPSSAVIGGEAYSKQRCFVKAVECDRYSASAWNNLGTTIVTAEEEAARRRERGEPPADPPTRGVAVVNNRPYSKCDCYLKAVMLDGKLARAWANLGSAMAPTDIVQYHMPKQQQQQQPQADPAALTSANSFVSDDSQGPSALGAQLSVFIPPVSAPAAAPTTVTVLLNRTEVLAKACEMEPWDSGAWLNLALLGQFVPPTKRRDDPKHFPDNFSTQSTGSQHDRNADIERLGVPSVRIGGDEITRLDCVISAAEADPTNVRAWAELASLMRDGEEEGADGDALEAALHPTTVEVGGVAMTRAQVEAKAADLKAPALSGNVAAAAGQLPPRGNSFVQR